MGACLFADMCLYVAMCVDMCLCICLCLQACVPTWFAMCRHMLPYVSICGYICADMRLHMWPYVSVCVGKVGMSGHGGGICD